MSKIRKILSFLLTFLSGVILGIEFHKIFLLNKYIFFIFALFMFPVILFLVSFGLLVYYDINNEDEIQKFLNKKNDPKNN